MFVVLCSVRQDLVSVVGPFSTDALADSWVTLRQRDITRLNGKHHITPSKDATHYHILSLVSPHQMLDAEEREASWLKL